jgi:hypothetical protein
VKTAPSAPSLARPEGNPTVPPRLLQWSRYLGGLLVETEKAQFIIGREDVDGLLRLGEMIRVEFSAGVSGSC